MRGAPVGSPAAPPNWSGAPGMDGSTYGNENGTFGPSRAMSSRRAAQAPSATSAAHRNTMRCCTEPPTSLQSIDGAAGPGPLAAARAVVGGDGGPLRPGVLDEARGA